MHVITRLLTTRVSRGQAVFETALFMPLFLLGFFGVLFAVSYATLAERVQFGVRYGGTVANLTSPYQSYSLYSMYDQVDGGKSYDPTSCGGAVPDVAQVNSMTRGSIWRGSSPSPSCNGGVGTITLGQDQPWLLENSYMTLAASTVLSGFMQSHVLGSGSNVATTTANGNFFRSPDVGSLVRCSTLANTVKFSLEATKDSLTTSAPATMLPNPATRTNAISAPMACSTFIPFDQLANVTAPPLVASSPTPAPPATPCPLGYLGVPGSCASPMPTPCPSGLLGTAPNCYAPTSPPTATPKPTPTPIATACPYTIVAGVCVVPTKPPTTPPTVAPPTMTPTTTPVTPTPVPTSTPPPTPPPTPTPLPTAGERS